MSDILSLSDAELVAMSPDALLFMVLSYRRDYAKEQTIKRLERKLSSDRSKAKKMQIKSLEAELKRARGR